MARQPIDTPSPAARPSVDSLAEAVRGNQRAGLARAITLVESTRDDHRALAQQLLLKLLPEAGGAHRIGITGVPGVGKSTFIDALGMYLLEKGHRVAVLAVDPSSTRTGGSILGDKTRMARLTVEKNAYIRPSPTSGTLGGVAKATRETIVLLEAAGFDVILVETVGVGQSEVTVANMVDCFTFLTLARTGDQLQGIKKGVLELADLVAVNKADGKHEREAKGAARELAGALRLIYPHDAIWKPPVITMSGLEGVGLDEFWGTVTKHREVLTEAGQFEEKRRQQQVDWTWTMVNDQLLRGLSSNERVRAIRADVEQSVRDGSLTAALAAGRILDAFDGSN
ncbi:methylmalonyl Co-A mutase-associated GTPase MeaB [Rhodococcus sp. IEGM 1409]|uniref:methylmalonyl Co-A mutase-associated GTPase MeaB n=1 Tax=Rhodococcus sp. IEGM 1409 TaxID=3047082 RepID=UPI0024B66F05|nr:methylmalonyl Co-A mutase-associated GTPase MeaB [Rhodococcus sp. IEGM 1409]MDI9900986.1 methylmalonyl Co-A mutase-associated GTPase MeaB [Rhodococcus sp. IEGM 1409]